MSASNHAAVVFTSKGIERICEEGGTQAWRMHQSRFGTFDYVICARNRRQADVEGPEEHGSAFLIGKVSGIVPATDPHNPKKPRFLIQMSEAAVVHNKPGFWEWGRWPTHYETLEALGIEPTDYDFKPLSEILKNLREESEGLVSAAVVPVLAQGQGRRSWKEAIDHAKTSLANELGVGTEAIEIAVRM